jgi:hypothetical protein
VVGVLVVRTKTGQHIRFQGAWASLAVADSWMRQGATWDWSDMEQTAAYFHREEQFHGRFGLIPGVLRCSKCDTNIWPPLPGYCAGCGRRIDWPASKAAAEEYNAAVVELDERHAD